MNSGGADHIVEIVGLPHRGELRTRLGLADERPIVLFLGRLHHKKGLDLLVPAFATGAPPEAVLVVAGPNEGGAREGLTAAAEALGIADRLVFTGMLDRRDRLLALVDADLFVLPSITGSAFVNAEGDLILDRRDPLCHGIRK